MSTHGSFIWRIVTGSLLFWLGSAALATFFSPDWPTTSDHWVNLALAALICEFLSIKIFQLVWPTTEWTGLGASLVAVNIGFLLVYLYIIAAALWPASLRSRYDTWAIRGELVLVLSWSAYELLRIKGHGGDERNRLTAFLTLLALSAACFLAWRLGVRATWNRLSL